jgi:hypothetical protein
MLESFSFLTKTYEATDPKKPRRRQYMIGNTVLAILDGIGNGYDETFEKLRVGTRHWEIYDHDVYENEALDQAPHKHCLNLLNHTGDPNRRDFWKFQDHFSDRFKTWYYRWAANLYNSVTAPDVALARYDKFKFVDPNNDLEVVTDDQSA